MAQKTLTARLKQKYDTSTNWTTNNTVLLAGELGFESDTGKFKIGDGTTAWNSLSYVSTGSSGTATDVQINGTSITSSNVANILTNGTYNSSTNKIATMSDLPSAITEISSQYTRITDLSTGVYKLTYNGTKYLYYNGTTSTSTITISGGKGAIILTVNRYSDTYWHWYYVNGSTGFETIYFGYTSSSSGSSSSKPLNSLLTSISSYVKDNLTYSTSGTTYALSAYQGYKLNQNKQDKLPTSSTAGQVLKSTSTAGTVEWGTISPTLPSDVAYFAEESGTPSVALPYYTKNEVDTFIQSKIGINSVSTYSSVGTNYGQGHIDFVQGSMTYRYAFGMCNGNSALTFASPFLSVIWATASDSSSSDTQTQRSTITNISTTGLTFGGGASFPVRWEAWGIL